MVKKAKGLSLILVLTLGLWGIFIFPCSSQSTDKLTIVTYYPSPYGVYNKLQSKKLSVGDTNNDGSLTADDLPNRDGDIRLKPQAGDPSSWSSGEEGQIAYSQNEDSIYHWNDTESKWEAQSGGVGVCISLKCEWSSWNSVGSCTPPARPSDFTDEGTGCTVQTIATTSSSVLYGGYCERWCCK